MGAFEKNVNLLYDGLWIFKWKWGVNFSHFPHKGLKGRDQADLKATAEGDEIKRDTASAAPAHINAALWAPPETNEHWPQSERGHN